jgi:hypothetical protein
LPDTDFVIIIIPAVNSRGRRLPGVFDAYVDGRWVCRSPEPLLHSARVLLRRGTDPAARIGMVHAAKPDLIALSAEIDAAARWTVKETPKVGPGFVPWKGVSRSHVLAPIRQTASAVPDPGQQPERFTSNRNTASGLFIGGTLHPAT